VAVAYLHAKFHQPFGHSTPTLETGKQDRTDNVPFYKRSPKNVPLLWLLYGIGQAIIFCRGFFFFPRLISAVAGWMSTILLHMVWP